MADIQIDKHGSFPLPPEGPGAPPNGKKSRSKSLAASNANPPIQQELALTILRLEDARQQLALTEARIATIEERHSATLRQRDIDHRADMERLLREIGELKAQIAKLEATQKP